MGLHGLDDEGDADRNTTILTLDFDCAVLTAGVVHSDDAAVCSGLALRRVAHLPDCKLVACAVVAMDVVH